MARYEHLPIYKQALDVAVHFERLVMAVSELHSTIFIAPKRTVTTDSSWPIAARQVCKKMSGVGVKG